MPEFNNGKPYHGSNAIQEGRLKGATGETDYFYLFCPSCDDDYILRILDYEVRDEQPRNPYDKHDEIESKAQRGFTLAFKLYCENCGHIGFVKLSNTGWQGGKYSEIMNRC